MEKKNWQYSKKLQYFCILFNEGMSVEQQQQQQQARKTWNKMAP